MLLFVLTKVKQQRKVFSQGTGAISVRAVIKLCPSALCCTDAFGVLSLLQLLKCFKNNIHHCRSGLNIDKQSDPSDALSVSN